MGPPQEESEAGHGGGVARGEYETTKHRKTVKL